MILVEFQGHKLSNSAMSIAFYYPKVSGGNDLLTDLRKGNLKNQKVIQKAKKQGKKPNPNDLDIDFPTMFKAYVAFRWAGDEEARDSSVEKIMSELDDVITNPEKMAKFLSVMNKLLYEKSKKD